MPSTISGPRSRQLKRGHRFIAFGGKKRNWTQESQEQETWAVRAIPIYTQMHRNKQKHMQYTLIMINNMPIRYSFESNLLIKYRGVHFSH